MAFIISAMLFKLKPYYAASLLVTGVFIRICIDLILFSITNGFERHFFPIEILFYTMIGGVICSFVWSLSYVKNNKSTRSK